MPKLGTKQATIEAGLAVAEYGLEYLNYTNVGKRLGLTGGAVSYHWKDCGATTGLRAAVIELARQRRNPFILGQLRAMRPLPDDARL